MAGNTFGKIFTLTSFGESHGKSIGGIIDGVPANFSLNVTKIQEDLDRRRPGQSNIVTQRKEKDTVQILSGLLEGKTLGTPIGFVINNEDHKSKDYTHLASAFRPSHADFTYAKKYGYRDYRGGGRASARETATRVVAGAIAKQVLQKLGVKINGFVSQVGPIKMKNDILTLDFSKKENTVRCPEEDTAKEMVNYIQTIQKEGDTTGGVVTCLVQNVPIGWGEPVFDKLHADLGKAMLSINAVKGFEYGSGFDGVTMKGSEHNDIFNSDGTTKTNYSGGIQGGISNGMPIYFKVAFKPVATIIQAQKTINEEKEKIIIQGRGRHDPCVVPRAVPIVEAMTAMVLLDYYLRNKTTQL